MTPYPLEPFDVARWVDAQIDRYGPVLGGENLRRFLGFRTPAAFHKARSQGLVGTPIFGLPGRQGIFALTSEVCAWVITQRIASQAAVGEDALGTSHDSGDVP